MKKISKLAFYYCASLENVTFHDGITEIGKYAFYECTSLKSVIIPNSVTKIGEYAFPDECVVETQDLKLMN